MKKTLFLACLSCLLVFCKKNNPDTGSGIANFPNNVGDKWVYQLSGAPSQTLTVQVVGNTTLPGGLNAAIWQYTYSAYTDSLYAAVNGDTVIIYNKTCQSCAPPTYAEVRRFVFPLTVGKTWYTASNGLTGQSLAETTITVPLGQYTKVFEVAQTSAVANDTLWLEEYVGFVKISQSESGSSGNGTWLLSSYNLK